MALESSQVFISPIAPTGIAQGGIIFADTSAGFSSDTANFFYDKTNRRIGINSTNIFAPLTVGTSTTYINMIASFAGSQDSYLQTDVQNYSTGTAASSDVVASADNSTDSDNYVDMGINSSGYTIDDNKISGGANGAYLLCEAPQLTIGAFRAGANIVFGTGGDQLEDERGRITDTEWRIGLAGETLGVVAFQGSTSGATTLQPAAVASGTLTLPATTGTLAVTSQVPLTKFDHYADVGNTHTDGTVDTLYTDTIAAGQLAANGDKIEAEYGGVFVSSATATREVQVFFGGTSIFDTGTLTLSLSSAWTCYVTIIRVSATVVRYMISLTTKGAALAAYTAVGELTGLTLSGTNILKITGQAAGVGAAANDVVAKLGTVIYYPSA